MDRLTITEGRSLYRKSVHSIEEVMALVPEYDGITKRRRINFCGDELYIDSMRYFVFRKDHCTCVHCGLKGTFFAKEKHEKDNRYHLNLYAFDKDGNEVLMTKDHYIPKSKGGSNDISNLNTMCSPCNAKKKDNIPKKEEDEND